MSTTTDQSAESPSISHARPDLPERWPAVVRAELERRHQRWGRWPTEPLLDVSNLEGRGLLAALIEADAEGRSVREVPGVPDGGFATVVSTAGLVRFADLGAVVRVLRAVLAPNASLCALEPGWYPGVVGLARSSVGALLPPVRGVHLARDLPGVLRDQQFVVTDIERFTMPTAVWPLRPFVQLRAEVRKPFGTIGDTKVDR